MNGSHLAWKKMQKVLVWTGIGVCCIFLCLYLWKENADKHIYEIPDYQKADLEELLNKKELSKEDYRFLFLQTGLSEAALQKLLEEGKEERIYRIQNRFFAQTTPTCEKNSIISWEEWNEKEEDLITFADLAESPLLEPVQVVGVNPVELRE